MRLVRPDGKSRSWVVGTILVGLLAGADSARADEKPSHITWHTDYTQAMGLAEQQGRSLLIYYYQPGKNACGDCFDCLAKTNETVARRLHDFVCVRLSMSATIRMDGKEVKLLDHPAFARLGGKPGIAILELAHKDSPNYGSVAKELPFDEEQGLARKLAVFFGGTSGANTQRKASGSQGQRWLTDYAQGVESARKQGKLLLIHFHGSQEDELQRQFESDTLSNPAVQEGLAQYVCVRLANDVTIEAEDGKTVRLLDSAAFAEMLGRPGIAILDFAHRDAPYFGEVVSMFPLLERHPYTSERMAEILRLPPGTLTQRTLIYAVRVHAERPQSAQGQRDTYLSEEAQSHAQYQAQIRVQGHHQWGSRFQRILGHLPLGLTASEVCAESWPGEHLLEAAIECVRCWRLSSGHWSKVSRPHPVYGYDMKLGSNGIWYATGIFGEGMLR